MSAHDHRRLALGTLAAVLVLLGLVVGGPFLYARVLAPTPDPTLALPTPTDAPTTQAPLPPLELAGTWMVGEGSEAGYRLDEVLSGQPVTVVGRTSDVTGAVVVEGDTLVDGRIRVGTASITTDESARDAYFRRALDTSTYPEAVFVLTGTVDVGAVADATEPVTVSAPGTLTFHGVSREVVAELQVQRSGDHVEVAGSIPVTLADHDLEAPDLGFVTVEPQGTVELLLVLRPQ